MELLDYLRVLRRGWRWIALAALLSTAAAAWVTSRQAELYSTHVKFFVSGQPAENANEALTRGYLSQQRIASYADLIVSRPYVEAALARAGAESVHDVSAAQVPGTVLLGITVVDSDPVRAAAVANAFGEVFPKLVDDVEKPETGGESPVRARVVEPAVAPSEPISPNPQRNVALGLALGLLLGCGVALGTAVLDTSLKTREEIERAAGGVNMLGGIPFDPKGERLLADVTPRSPRAESFRQIRTSVQFAGIDEPLRSLVVTSPMPHEGKSSVTANLALALAHGGQRVLVVDADLRRPALAEYFGIEGAVGLTSLLLGTVSLQETVRSWGGGLLDVLPSGPVPPNPAEVIGSHAMLELIKFLEQRYDVVLFDAPPVVPVTDAALLAANTNGAIVVVRVGRTTGEQLERTADTLRRVGVRLIGTIANGVPAVDGKAYNYAFAESDALVSSAVFPRERLRFAARRSGPPPRKRGSGPDGTPDAGPAVDALLASARVGRWQRVADPPAPAPPADVPE